MKKKIAIIIVIVLIIILAIVLALNMSKDEKQQNSLQNDVQNNLDTNRMVSTDANEINEIKNSINATGQTDIYQIEEEYDGRKIIQVKPDVQYEVALAGILKNGMPKEDEIDTLLEQSPKNSGVWISQSSREKFLNLLKTNNISSFEIDNDGYLKCIKDGNLTDIEEKLKGMINSNKLYVIDMSGKTYQRDYISGEIIEYPFEEMDPYQVIEPYETENAIILGVTSNKNESLGDDEILNAIIAY